MSDIKIKVKNELTFCKREINVYHEHAADPDQRNKRIHYLCSQDETGDVLECEGVFSMKTDLEDEQQTDILNITVLGDSEQNLPFGCTITLEPSVDYKFLFGHPDRHEGINVTRVAGRTYIHIPASYKPRWVLKVMPNLHHTFAMEEQQPNVTIEDDQ